VVLGCLAVAAVLLAVFVIVELRSAQPMFDMKLFKLPTFSGGSVAAFGLSASIFSMLLYLVLYLQDILGYSPLATGVRLMVISGGVLVTSTVAGRLTSRVPVRLLIGPGLIVIGAGLLLMRGLGLDPSHPGNDRGGWQPASGRSGWPASDPPHCQVPPRFRQRLDRYNPQRDSGSCQDDRRDVSECTHHFPPDLWRVRDSGPRHRYASSRERAAPL
jgi:hypothetical protein